MDPEEMILVQEDECPGPGTGGPIGRRHSIFAAKNKSAVDRFLGRGRRFQEAGILPRYYAELLTWALWRYMEEEGWQIGATLGYQAAEPVFTDVSIGVDRRENLLMNGQLLAEKGPTRLVVTVDVNLRWRGAILVEGSVAAKKEVSDFVAGVLALAKQRNFYRGQKLECTERLRFLDLKGRTWDSIILDESTKREIRANTVAFLGRRNIWEQYGIQSRRGVLLAGEPGTGKTIVCKALMAEAEDITCIIASAYAMDADDYLTELYELAADLSPSMVFIEDIDLIGQSREEFGYPRGNALLSLLSELDGVEEKNNVVTVATTNCLDILDKALSQRPSRFDRVITLRRPGLDGRQELVDRLCRKIPLAPALQGYIARKTEGCTPAQVQEVIHSLVIERNGDLTGESPLNDGDVDRVLSRINGRGGHPMGFCVVPNSNGKSRLAPFNRSASGKDDKGKVG